MTSENLDPKVRRLVDTRLRSRGEFTYAAIQEELQEHYRIGDDLPDFDDLHLWITQLHKHYVDLGLAQEGE